MKHTRELNGFPANFCIKCGSITPDTECRFGDYEHQNIVTFTNGNDGFYYCKICDNILLAYLKDSAVNIENPSAEDFELNKDGHLIKLYYMFDDSKQRYCATLHKTNNYISSGCKYSPDETMLKQILK